MGLTSGVRFEKNDPWPTSQRWKMSMSEAEAMVCEGKSDRDVGREIVHPGVGFPIQFTTEKSLRG